MVSVEVGSRRRASPEVRVRASRRGLAPPGARRVRVRVRLGLRAWRVAEVGRPQEVGSRRTKPPPASPPVR
eukprot:scaffold36210_cov33-Phaeocystis_antarctica.AAC.1